MAKPSQLDLLASEQIRTYMELVADRDSRFATDWQHISDYFLPQQSDVQTQKTEGVVGWTDGIFDTTAIQAGQTLRSGQYNWLTPPNQPWAEFGVPDELKADKDADDEGVDEATKWLGKASDTAMKELARCNFYSMVSIHYLGKGIFATDTLLAEEGQKTALNFRHCKINTYVIEENDEGTVDTLRYKITLTYRQALQMFNKPGDVLPPKMADQAKDASGKLKEFEFIHCIFPREDSDRLPGKKDGANKPIASVYIAVDFKAVVRVGGFEESPILCSRFDKWGTGTVWGYGPAYLVLPEVRQLNYVQQYMDALAELHAYPRVLIPDNLEGDVDLRAGGTTTWDTSIPAGKPEEWATVGDYKMGLEMQEQRRQVVKDAFYTSAFKLLNSDPLLDKKMTAYEISQRQAENLSEFTPAFARAITEFLNPLMLRVFGILYRKGKFGTAPDSLMQDVGGGKRALVMPQVVITSRISDALKALKNRGTEEVFQFAAPLLEAQPDLLDTFDMDAVMREYGANAGMPPDLIRSVKDVKIMRAQRAQAMNEQAQAQKLLAASEAAKNMGQAPGFMQANLQAAAA